MVVRKIKNENERVGKIIEGLSTREKHYREYAEKAEKILKSRIDESSLSRIWQYVEDPKKTFGVITSYREGGEDNEGNFIELKSDVRSMGKGYIALAGGYEEIKKDGSVVLVKEPSLLVPKIRKKDLIELGVKYDQDSVIYKDEREFKLISTSNRGGNAVGATMIDFKKGAGRNNLELSKKALKNFFSALLKGSHRGRRFVFKEGVAESFSSTPGHVFFLMEKCPNSHFSKYYAADLRWFRIYEEYGEFIEEGE